MLVLTNNDTKKLKAAADIYEDLDERVLEKDILVVRVLEILSNIHIDGMTMTFCGGTCLSRAYGVIGRMSEDIDFKLWAGDDTTPSQGRKRRGRIKRAIMASLEEAGFTGADCRAKNENKFFSMNIPFGSAYPAWGVLRPFVRIECIHMPLFFEPSLRPICSITDEILGVPASFGMLCQDMRETLMEKTLAVLRRLTDDRPYYSQNPYLMRHIYDAAKILETGVELDGEMVEAFRKKIGIETAMFGTHCADLARDPVEVMRDALSSLWDDPVHRHDYETMILPMLFDKTNTDYNSCLEAFSGIAKGALDGIAPAAGESPRP